MHYRLHARCLRLTYLNSQGGNDALGMDQLLVAQVVQATISKDLGASLEPHGLTELHTGILGQQLGGQHAQSTQQGPTRVDQLNLPVAGEGLAAKANIALVIWLLIAIGVAKNMPDYKSLGLLLWTCYLSVFIPT